jgi:predicted lipoprotein with Yx(FWY)xxD motif
MTRKQLTTAIASVGVIALVVAGCGSSGGGKSSASSTPAAAASSTTAATVNGTTTSLGKIITNGQGRTLYVFAGDTGPASMCSGACATNWPPYLATKKPAGGGGVSAGSITLVKRADGKKQVALGGHPLYYFAGDQASGQMNGQGVDEFGAKWWAVAPSGTSVMAAAKSSGGSGGSSSGNSYAY